MKVFKHILIFLAANLILLPSIVSFSHIFSDHTHKLCDNYAEHHYHAKSLDCDLHKFHKNPVLIVDNQDFDLVTFFEVSRITFDYYQFLNDYEPLNFDLRGPPGVA